MLILMVEETSTRRGRFDGWIDGELVVQSSRQPFLDASRELMKRGVDPATILMMRHRKTGTDSLRGPIGKAAKLDVAGGRFTVYRGGNAVDKPACEFSGTEPRQGPSDSENANPEGNAQPDTPPLAAE
jgi:hypothetical protein